MRTQHLLRYHIFIIVGIWHTWIQPIDNVHFYRANHFWAEPRFERCWLTSVDFSLGGARSRTGRNSKGERVGIFNIFGLHNMQLFGKDVPIIHMQMIKTTIIDISIICMENTGTNLEKIG